MDEWQFGLSDAVGFVGVALLVGTYGALQVGRLSAEAPAYSALNAGAAVLIAISLLFNFNAASMAIEIFWFLISLYGLQRSLRSRRARVSVQKGGTDKAG